MPYYIWSRDRSTSDQMYFWKPFGRSYTPFLEEAGIFEEKHTEFFKVLLTKKQVTYAKKLDKYAHENFLIPVNKIEILGIKKTTIIPYK